jgi:cyclic beta-1,2-glucan synthetase
MADDRNPLGEPSQGWAAALAAAYGRTVPSEPDHAPRIAVPGRDLPGRDLELYESWLAEAHRHFRSAIDEDLALSHAAEWLLDNYYIVRQALRQLVQDLSPGYYRRLPKLAAGPMAGYPRVYALARAVAARQRFLLNVADLQDTMIQVQSRVPLTLGELWAVPLFTRYTLIEVLAQALLRLIHPERSPLLPQPAPEPIAAADAPASPRGDPSGDEVVANTILGLRTAAEQDWSDFVEAVSETERILRCDPAGVYETMDFATRNRYRQEIEKLAFAGGLEEQRVAAMALNLARQAANREGVGARHAHVGEYLLGSGRATWQAGLGYRPGWREALKRAAGRHVPGLYLSSILCLAALLAWGAGLIWRGAAGGAPNSVWGWLAAAMLAIAVAVAALTMATGWVNWALTWRVPPRILPKLELKQGIPETLRTMVVVPAMLTDRDEIHTLVHQLEMHYLRNPEPQLLFALLTDFRDADRETLPEDAALVNRPLPRSRP